MHCDHQPDTGSIAHERLQSLMVTRDRAVRVAEVLLQCYDVHEVLLFGSLARANIGRDIDLILIADEFRSNIFMSKALEEMSITESIVRLIPERADMIRNGAYGHKRARQDAAVEAIDGLEDVLYSALGVAYPASLDIFVFPPEWRDRLEVLQFFLPHSDPHFMQNIARDAISIGRNPR